MACEMPSGGGIHRISSPFLRGWLEVKAQLSRRPGAATRLDCRFDELDETPP